LFTDLGFELRDLDSFEKTRNKTTGIMVVSVYKNSTIGNARIEPGFIITKINKQKVDSVMDLEVLLKKASGTVLLEGLYENYPGEFPYSFIK
jgi:S1-C subfamily serine protease